MNNERKRTRRTFSEIENDIMEATRILIEENGFQHLSLRGVARKARIEPRVFYHRYKDLTELLEKFTERYDYWYTDLISSFEDVPMEKYQEYFEVLFVSLTNELVDNKSMQQLLLWELMEDNAVTRRTNAMREQYTDHIVKGFERYFAAKKYPLNVRAISGMLIGAIYFILIHRGKATFCGIDYNTPEGLNVLTEMIRYISDRIFNKPMPCKSIGEVALRMKNKGIEIQIISECTGLTIEEIEII